MMRVFVYFNLHTHLWSIKALDGYFKNKVIAHAESVVLKNPIARVSESGRQRVIETKQKNVHAGLVGEIESLAQNTYFKQPVKHLFNFHDQEQFNSHLDHAEHITYNPYKYSSFVYRHNENTYVGSDFAYFKAVPRILLVK